MSTENRKIIKLKPLESYDLNVQLPGLEVDEGIIYVSSDENVFEVSATGVVSVAAGAKAPQVAVIEAHKITAAGTLLESVIFIVGDADADIEAAVTSSQPVVTASATLSPVGIADPGATVTVKDSQGNVLQTVTADSRGYWKAAPVASQNLIIDRTFNGASQTVSVALGVGVAAAASVATDVAPTVVAPTTTSTTTTAAPPAAPSSKPALRIDTSGNNSDSVSWANVAWDAVARATSYEIRFDGGSWSDLGNVLTYHKTGTPSGSVTAEVRAVNATGAGPASDPLVINFEAYVAPTTTTTTTEAPTTTTTTTQAPTTTTTTTAAPAPSVGELITGLTASASMSYDPQLPPSNVIDGNATTAWVTGQGIPGGYPDAYVQLDMPGGVAHSIDKFKMRTGRGTFIFGFGDTRVDQFHLVGSNDNWATAGTTFFSGSMADAGAVDATDGVASSYGTFTFPAASYKSVRIYIDTTVSPGQHCMIVDAQLYGVIQVSDPTLIWLASRIDVNGVRHDDVRFALPAAAAVGDWVYLDGQGAHQLVEQDLAGRYYDYSNVVRFNGGGTTQGVWQDMDPAGNFYTNVLDLTGANKATPPENPTGPFLGTVDNATVIWPDTDGGIGGNGSSYLGIKLRVFVNGVEQEGLRTTYAGHAANTSMALPNLPGGATYTFKIAAYNAKGDGNYVDVMESNGSQVIGTVTVTTTTTTTTTTTAAPASSLVDASTISLSSNYDFNTSTLSWTGLGDGPRTYQVRYVKTEAPYDTGSINFQSWGESYSSGGNGQENQSINTMAASLMGQTFWIEIHDNVSGLWTRSTNSFTYSG